MAHCVVLVFFKACDNLDETWCDRTYSGVVNCYQMSVSHINRSRTKKMIFH